MPDYLRKLLDNSIFPVIAVDQNQSIVVFNCRAEELWHTDEKEAKGKNLFSLMPELDCPAFLNLINSPSEHNDEIQNLKVKNLMFRVSVSYDNTLFWIFFNTLDDSEGDIPAKQKDHYKWIIKQSEAGYFFIDRDGIIRDVNAAWLKYYKYDSPDEVIGKHFQIIQKLEDVNLAKEFVKGIMNSNKTYMKGEFSRKNKDGSAGYHTFSAWPFIENKEVTGIEGLIFDSTEKKETEIALRQSQLELENLFTNMVDGFAYHKLIYNNAGKPSDYIFLKVNPAFEELTGLKSKDIIGRCASEVLPGTVKSFANTLNYYAKVVDSGQPIKYKKYSPGLKRWFYITAYSNMPGYFVLIFENLQGRKRFEKMQGEEYIGEI